MVRVTKGFVLFFSWFLFSTSVLSESPKNKLNQRQLALFIGNSHTYVNSPTLLLEALSISNNDKVRVVTAMSVIGGAPLKKHWDKGNAEKLLNKYNWAYVVIQDAGWAPYNQPKIFHQYVEKFHKIIQAKKSKTLLYLTWRYQRKGGVSQTVINKVFFETARKLGITLVPAGIAVSEVGRLRPALNLYKEDNVHMNPYGAYLVASVFYSTIYKKQASIIKFAKLNPRRYGRLLQYGDLNKDTLKFLSKVAWETVKAIRVRK